MTTHSRILAWKISWTEELGGLQSTWSKRVWHDWRNWAQVQTHTRFEIPSYPLLNSEHFHCGFNLPAVNCLSPGGHWELTVVTFWGSLGKTPGITVSHNLALTANIHPKHFSNNETSVSLVPLLVISGLRDFWISQMWQKSDINSFRNQNVPLYGYNFLLRISVLCTDFLKEK